MEGQGRALGSARQEGGSEGRGLGPGAQQAPQCLRGQGKLWLRSLPFLRAPPPPSPPGSPPSPLDPNRGWVPLGVGTPPLATPQGCWSQRSGLYFCSPFPPSPSLRTCMAGGGLSGKRIRPGISAGSWGPKWAGQTWPSSLLILSPPNGSPISPFGHGIPSPSPDTPQGHQFCPASISPPTPHILPGLWGFLPFP